MNYKKLGICMLVAFILTGCASGENENNEENFSISEQKITEYTDLIESTLNTFYWRYDSDTIAFSDGKIPTDDEILECSRESGYDMSGSKGDNCVIATANLLYFNREVTGTIYFYFVKDSLKGLYYIPDSFSKPCSMYVRNSYFVSSPFISAETEKEPKFVKERANYIGAQGIFDTIAIDDYTYSIMDYQTKLIINRSDASTPLYTLKEIDNFSEKLIPISAVFINNSTEMAVLYGSEVYSDNGAVPMTVPKKIVIYDNNFNSTDSVVVTEDSDCYSLGYENGCLLVARDKSIDFYALNGTQISPKQISYYLGKSVIGMKLADLDNDGVTEYIFTDGQDLYIYHKTISVFKCIWSTHLSIESFEKYIYAADLNNDGVKEIYVFDSTGTTSKYVIGENGMYIKNDNIDYGQRYQIADFNSDGNLDCIVIGDEDSNTQELRIYG
ncbi:MAG: VCBS repeat-containing protein [Candidatus Metalachnospira sp.]|nr:VCBS repeat-containing protein [Candidatus Metalachnospira sp.]